MDTRAATLPSLAAMTAFAVLASVAVARLSPDPSADVGRGSEDAFARGLHRREIPPGHRPQRWTTETARLRFHDLPGGPARLDVRLHGQRTPVAVVVDGTMAGVVPVGATAMAFDLPGPGRGTRTVELRTDGFTAGDGRRLGALLDAVTLTAAARGRPPLGLVLEFLLPALLAWACARMAGWPPAVAALVGAGASLFQALMLWPAGAAHSPYARVLAGLMAAGLIAAAVFARWRGERPAGASRWAFLALLAALFVQGLLATSPLMVVSDAVFHANNLARVASGDWFLTSVTQHAHPFRIPYGVSFYGLLVPFYRAGLDAVWLVRAGAAAAAVAGSAALFLLLAPASPARAALAVTVLQLLPITFDVFSYGNFSNVFGQALTLAFFAWWAGTTPGGWPVGGLLLAVGGLSHLSSLIVLLALAAALVAARRRTLPADRTRWLAVGAGLVVLVAYYLSFASLVASQLPRLLEGGGQGHGATGLGAVLLDQALRIVHSAGLPALALAAAGLLRAGAAPLGRDLGAYWAATAALAAMALVSPLEVRYVYAATLPLAVAAAWAAGDDTRDHRGRGAVVVLLLLVQAGLAARNVAEALVGRYR